MRIFYITFRQFPRLSGKVVQWIEGMTEVLQYVCELESVEHDTLLASLYSDRHGCVEDQLRYATSLFTAATTNDVVDDAASSALGEKHMRLVTGEVNRLVADVLNMTPPPPVNGDASPTVTTDLAPRTCARIHRIFYYTAPLPPRSTSVYEDTRTATTSAPLPAVDVPWPARAYYLPECTTAAATNLLLHREPGTFLIRRSQRHPPWLALSVVCRESVVHVLVEYDVVKK